MFECLVLYTLCQLPSGYKPLPTVREICLQHRASILQKLRARINDPRLCADDITLHAIIGLMTSDFHMSEDDHVEMHRSGLRRVVAMRGGLEGGSIDSMTSFAITGAEFLCDMAIKRRGPSKPGPILPHPDLQYPRHPFPPQLSRLIARLPEGFRELAMARKISLQTVKLLHQVAVRLETLDLELIPSVWGKSEQFGLMRIAATDSAPKLEQRLCMLVLVFERNWLETTGDQGRSRRLDGRIGQVWDERLLDCMESLPQLERDADVDFMIWAAFVRMTTGDASKLSTEESDELMTLLFLLCPRQMKSWETVSMSLKRYFWSPPLMDRWHTKWLGHNSSSV